MIRAFPYKLSYIYKRSDNAEYHMHLERQGGINVLQGRSFRRQCFYHTIIS